MTATGSCDRIVDIRAREPDAAFRSNFIVGYPGRDRGRPRPAAATSSRRPQLDWCGFFAYSREDGTYAADLDGAVDPALMNERLAELRELQDDDHRQPARRADRHDRARCSSTRPASPARTARRRRSTASSHVGHDVAVGSFAAVEIVDALGPDLVAGIGVAGRRVTHGGDSLMVDPSQIATWANAITVGRLLLSPLMFWVIPNDDRGSWIAFVLWLIFCAQRRHRRLHRPPPRGHHGRARSSIRSPTRCSCSARCSRSCRPACSGWCR